MGYLPLFLVVRAAVFQVALLLAVVAVFVVAAAVFVVATAAPALPPSPFLFPPLISFQQLL